MKPFVSKCAQSITLIPSVIASRRSAPSPPEIQPLRQPKTVQVPIELLMTFSHAIWLAVGGGLGTLSRVLVIMLAVRLCGRDFPWGTFAVNLFGSFLFGLIVAFGRGRISLPAGLETVLLVGFLGGFTTYSSFAFQSYELFQEGKPALAGVYMIGTTLSGLVVVWLGVIMGRFCAG